MNIEIKSIRLERALHGLQELQDADHLIVHSEQSLVAVGWKELQYTQETVTVTLGPKGQGTVLADNVAVDNAWILQPKTQRLLLAREGGFDSLDPTGHAAREQLKIAGLANGTFASAVDPDGRRVLLAVLRVINPDSAVYGIAVAELATGRLIRETTFGSTADLELLWDAQFHSWVVGETSSGRMWRWDEAKPAASKLAGTVAGLVHAATFVAGENGVIASALVTEKTGARALVIGVAGSEQVAWGAPVALPGPGALLARRHPAKAVWAYLAHEGRGQRVQVRDASGKVLAEAPLRPEAHLSNLIWSPSSPKRIWGIGIHSLAAITLQ